MIPNISIYAATNKTPALSELLSWPIASTPLAVKQIHNPKFIAKQKAIIILFPGAGGPTSPAFTAFAAGEGAELEFLTDELVLLAGALFCPAFSLLF